ncbi:MAG: hypothetical protein ACOC9W_06115 [Persicimonas sp.]
MVEESNNNEQPEEFDADDFDEEVDLELLELAENRRQGSILQPILFLAVIWFGVSIIGDWQTQLDYFFSSSEPVELGRVDEFAVERAKDEQWEPDIPHNRYVSLKGVPSRRAQSKRSKFFKLVGDQVYVQVPKEDDDGKSDLEREFSDEKGEVDRTYFEGAGRALHLSKTTGRYQGLRQYYYERYSTRLCGTDLPELPEQSAEQAEGGEPECIEGYLIEGGVTPMNHWWYLALSGLIGVFVFLNIWWLIRWVRNFVRN